MPKLNQIVAIVNGEKTKTQAFLTTVHRGWHKDRITGLNRTYQPINDDGEKFPPEQKQVQLMVRSALGEVREKLGNFYNLVATQDYTNCTAKANVVVDGKTIIPEVPVTMLMFLDKQLTDLRTFISNIPTLPTDQIWKFDDGKNCYVTDVVQSVKTQKVPTNFVKFAPTQHQPGQAEIIHVDKTIGYWSTIHMSGAMPEKERDDMLARVEQLQDAVLMAREEANSMQVIEQKQIGKQVFDFVFGGGAK